MSNLSDLLPAGASAKQLTFTDSGSGISSKAPVVLNSDGTVSEVSGASAGNPGKGSTAVYDTTSTLYTSVVYDANANKVVVAYKNLGNNYGYAAVGTVSGTTLSWGTPVAFNSNETDWIATAYSSSDNKICIAYRNSSGYGQGIMGTVSGTSISFGSATNFNAASTTNIGIGYDVGQGKFAVAFRDDGNSDYGTLVVGSVSGTSISFGSEFNFQLGQTSYHSLAYDANASKLLLAYRTDFDTGHGTSNVCTISGTSITVGGSTQFQTGSSTSIFATYDSTAQKIVIGYTDATNSSYATGIVGTVSGTSVSYGTKQAFTTESASVTSVLYDDNNDTTIMSYTVGGSPYNALVVNGTVSGTSISFSSAFALTTDQVDTFFAGAYDTSSNNVVFAFRHVANAQMGTGIVYTNEGTNLTAQAFVGVADSAISASAAGSVIVQGGTVSGVSPELATGSTTDLTGKTQSPYPVLTYDTTHSKFVAFFQDANNSNYGTAVVITVSGSTVSFGTPVVFESAATYAPDAVYNAAADQHMVVYPDYGNSQQATAVVGSVSGTSITFGTPAIYDTGTANVNASVGYNATLGKYLAAATPTSYAADDLKVYVLSVSGTTITAGSGVTVGSGKRYPNIVANDSASDFVLTNNTGNNQAEAHLISVSGTTPTVEDTEAITSVVSSSFPYTGLVFLESNKFVCVTNDATNDNMYTRTITVSGTSLSIGTQSSAFTVDRDAQTTINGAWPLFFVSATEAYLYYQDDTSNYLKYIPITISGTTATGGTEVTYHSTAVAYTGFLYNSSSKQSVSFFQDSSQTKGLAQNGALTVGTKYYVTTSGKFSSSADTPSVNAGIAISTTSLLLNGDS